MVKTVDVQTENDVHCPKCGNGLREIEKEVKPFKDLNVVGHDMYCDKCHDVMMTIF